MFVSLPWSVVGDGGREGNLGRLQKRKEISSCSGVQSSRGIEGSLWRK